MLLIDSGYRSYEDDRVPAYLFPPCCKDDKTAEILIADKKADRLSAKPSDDIVDESAGRGENSYKKTGDDDPG
ncbi:hypothetical protein D3C76_1807520 [compost metagenome]